MDGMFTYDFAGFMRVGVWLVLLLGFLFYYARSFRNYGAMTFSSAFFLKDIFLTLCVMFPFAFMEENFNTIGLSFYSVVEYLDKAFYLSVFGIVCMLGGMWVAFQRKGTKEPVLEGIRSSLMEFWLTTPGIMISGVVLVVGLFGMFALGLQPFKGREFAFAHPEYRPLINAYLSLVVVFSINTLVHGVAAKNKMVLVLGVVFGSMGLIGGTRGASVGILIAFLPVLMIATRYRNLVVICAAILAVMVLGVAVALIRDSVEVRLESFGDILLLMRDQIVFGNNLSELRDYAWALSGLDIQGTFLWGKSYLAAVMSFIPSSISEFRNTWAIGRVTPVLAGMDPMSHAGLRTTLFGEAYLNFGIPGIAVIAGIFGYFFGRIHRWVHHQLEGDPYKLVKVWAGYIIAMRVLWNMVFTPGFFTIYVLLGLYGAGKVATYMLKPKPFSVPQKTMV